LALGKRVKPIKVFSGEVDSRSHEENGLSKTVFEAGNPMCLLCDDEKAYAAYMHYLDAMAREGKAADPDKAVDAVLDQLEAADKANHKGDDPANDKTLSPFFCSPVNK
jgi:hypothetical protein